MNQAEFLDFSPNRNSNKCKSRKIKAENGGVGKILKPKKSSQGQTKINDCFKTEKKRIDRFDGFPEAELYNRCLPDHLSPNLDILIIGINPGLFAAFKGHHYAGPGNHFWKCLYLSGLIPEPLTALDDYKLIQYGIGFTNIVQRTTRGSSDLKPQEIKEGAKILLEKIKRYRPKIAVFNGKEIFRIFSGRKDFDFGRQPAPIDGTQTLMYVMPSSSARCSQLPRATDKVPYYLALKKLRDYLCGRIQYLDDSEVTFSSVLVTAPRKSSQPNVVTNGIVQSKLLVKAEMIVGIENGDDDDQHDRCGLDKDGRPKLIGGPNVFDEKLVKKELNDENNDDEQINSFLARENSSAVAELTSILDKSYFVALGVPDYTTDINVYNNGLTIYQPNLVSSQYFAPPVVHFTPLTAASVDGNGCNGDGQKNEGGEAKESGGDHDESEGNGDNNQPPYENGSKDESTNASNQLITTDSGSLQAQVPSAAQQTPAASCNLNILEQSSNNNLQLSQQINGENSPIVTVKTEPSVQQHHPTPAAAAPAHPPSTCNLPPEIALHVEQAIEAVVQRARDGPLEMPAFRTPAEKSAAAHAHQQQQHQQQMFANLQLQAAAAAAAAAHFDLRGMKGAESVGGVPAAALLGANYEQSCQASSASANAPSLYSQYFQQPQANQSSFPAAGSAGFGTSAAVGAGYGSQWTFTTATTTAAGPNAVMYNHPSNMMAAAPYFQNAAAFPGQQLYHQGSGANSGTGGGTNLPFASSSSPYFNQQQAAVAAQQQQSMYGNYVTGFNMQQQSPHNL